MTAPSRTILLVGLTGGIASGKSEVDRMLRRLGAAVIDADETVHCLLATDRPTADEIRSVFGDGVIAPDGAVDRKALGAIVFHDTETRTVLNTILHPKTRGLLAERIRHVRDNGTERIVIVDAALLVETGYHREFDRIVLISSPAERQIERIMARDGLSREEALARVAAQWPTEAKIESAHYRIDNDGTIDELREKVEDVYERLLEDWKQKAAAEAPTV